MFTLLKFIFDSKNTENAFTQTQIQIGTILMLV